jgi:hypothetical protein
MPSLNLVNKLYGKTIAENIPAIVSWFKTTHGIDIVFEISEGAVTTCYKLYDPRMKYEIPFCFGFAEGLSRHRVSYIHFESLLEYLEILHRNVERKRKINLLK